jgi:hypothetical protein
MVITARLDRKDSCIAADYSVDQDNWQNTDADDPCTTNRSGPDSATSEHLEIARSIGQRSVRASVVLDATTRAKELLE